MLHEETVSNRTLELLKSLMQDPVLESFNLPKSVLYHEDIDHSVKIDLLTMRYDFQVIKDFLERLVSKPNELHIIGNKRGDSL